MATALPLSTENISASWLSEVLATPIAEVEVKRLGADRGYSGELATVRYAARRIVAKISSAEDGARELLFYQRLGSQMPIRIPRLIFGASEGERTVLLLEYVDATQGDNLVGCTPSQTAALLRTLARLHAAFWQSPLLEGTWLSNYDDPSDALERLRKRKARFLEQYGGRFPRVVRERSATIDVASIWKGLARSPRTLLHDDFHLDNVLFDGETPVVLDWECAAVGVSGVDVARFLVECVTVEQRRALGDTWLTTYVDELHAHGIDYSRDAVRADVANALLRCLVGLLGCTFGERSPSELPDRLQALLFESIDRTAHAVADML